MARRIEGDGTPPQLPEDPNELDVNRYVKSLSLRDRQVLLDQASQVRPCVVAFVAPGRVVHRRTFDEVAQLEEQYEGFSYEPLTSEQLFS